MAGYDLIDDLRDAAQRVIGDNALILAGHAAGAQPTPPEKQWWNLPAKIAAGHRIADEELQRSRTLAPNHDPHNDAYDAMRHARWSSRMANEIDPVFAQAAGVQHEGANLLESLWKNPAARTGVWSPEAGRTVTSIPQTVAESIMDLRNNAEGLRAAREGRPIDPARLTWPPVAPGSYLAGGSSPATYDQGGRPPPYSRP